MHPERGGGEKTAYNALWGIERGKKNQPFLTGKVKRGSRKGNKELEKHGSTKESSLRVGNSQPRVVRKEKRA